MRKTRDYWILLANYGYGWEEIEREYVFDEIIRLRSEHTLACPTARYKLHHKLERIDNNG